MRSREFISFILILFINYIYGCTVHNSEKVDIRDFSIDDELIESVVLTNLNLITFDKNGGKYQHNFQNIKGMLIDGKEITISMSQINEIRIDNGEEISLNNLDSKKIVEVVCNNNDLVRFNSNGGEFNKSSGKIVGKTIFDKEINLEIKNVLRAYSKKPKTIKFNELNINTKINQIVLKNSDKCYIFKESGGRYFEIKSSIVGKTINNEEVAIEKDSILYLNVQRTDVGRTIIASFGIIVVLFGVAALIVLATKQSCPFIYSFDGERYVFDAEPLGGATTKGLERTEYSKLDYLTESDGYYKLLVRNEVEETQYLDELKIISVKHEKEFEVIPDLDGNFYKVKNPILPKKAIDENGLDLLNAISKNDQLYWQTKLPVDSSTLSKNLKHKLAFTFDKPQKVQKAKLIVNFGTSLWGSRMIREMLQLYGGYVDNYNKKIDEKGEEYNQLMNFIEKEELYKLKYFTNDGINKKFQGYINGGGPLVTETRIYNLDLSDINNNSFTLEVEPPFGFWTVNYLAIDYEEYAKPVIDTLVIQYAKDQIGEDHSKTVCNKDNTYYIMPKVGDYFEIGYKYIEGTTENRTFFLKSSGYYELHLNKNAPFQFNILSKIVSDKGYIIKYSNEKFNIWQQSEN